MAKPSFTKKDYQLIFLMSEVPYVTINFVWKLFYPENKSNAWARQKLKYLLDNGYCEKLNVFEIGWIYYLTPKGYLLSSSYTFIIKKFKAENAVPKIFSNHELKIKPFSKFYLGRNQPSHTLGLLEFYMMVYKSQSFFYKIWIDNLINKKSLLKIQSNPDFVFTNNLEGEEGRLFVELENSKIREDRLSRKLNLLCEDNFDDLIIACSSQDIFLNMGRSIRKLVSGKSKSLKGSLNHISVKTRNKLSKNIWICKWIPSHKNDGVVTKISSLALFTFDHELFDSKVWANKIDEKGIVVKNEFGDILHERKQVPFTGRKSPQQENRLLDIFKKYHTHYIKEEAKFYESYYG